MALQSISTQRRLLTTPEMGVLEAPPGSNGSSIQDVQDLPPRDLAVLRALSSTVSSSALKMCIFSYFLVPLLLLLTIIRRFVLRLVLLIGFSVFNTFLAFLAHSSQIMPCKYSTPVGINDGVCWCQVFN